MVPNKMSPFRLTNIRLFILFRVLFNARFYYPVFTILFLDYGLSLEQFSLLNTVWAFTIVLTEVPSGALADVFGRKRLLVATSMLMVIEMTLLAFVPLGNMRVIFVVFLLNRILSGLAEAMASGTDEALAYDTLVEHGLEKQWPRVLEVQMWAQNIGFMIAMTLGAAVYDPGVMNSLREWLGMEPLLSQQVTMRYPLYLTFGFSMVACLVTLLMRDPLLVDENSSKETKGYGIAAMTRMTLSAGGWILRTPFALAVILYATTLDHILRMLVTMTSQYYRLIHLPEAIFGILGSIVAVVGLIVPRIARRMTERFSPAYNVAVLAGTMLVALLALTWFIPYVGVLPMLMVFWGMMMTSFFTSHYLNEITSSSQRATVLSFKGLAFNAAYGLIGILYAGLMVYSRERQRQAFPDLDGQVLENEAFKASLQWAPCYLLIGLLLVTLICWPLLRKRSRDL
ncbi:MFS transporter [Desulfogranum japonicum]|uniref:MFS transporter n=1 Tax=Desulfogranum japonicum TaxID=231447 RepID=UPI00048D5497|nr:MFS transporter [Desulfogranum japonicum]